MAPARPLLVSALLALAFLSGCGGEARDATSKELSALTAEISKLRAEQAALSERMGALERAKTPPVTVSLGASDARPSDSPAPAAVRPLDDDRPSLDVVKLGPAPAEDGDGDTDESGPRTVLRSGANGIVVEETNGTSPASRTVVSDPKKPSSKKSDKADRKKTAASPKP